MDRTGLIHIYTGEGKGKTTAAIGLSIRALGNGMKVLLVQFLKGSDTSELKSLKLFEPDISVMRGFNCKKFVWNMTPEEIQNASTEAASIFAEVKELILKGQYDLVILDELLGILSLKFLEVASVFQLIEDKPKHVELVLTGRCAPQELIDKADYVSEIKAIKHPYDKGVSARRGIEF